MQQNDIDVLKQLAARYMEYASLPIQKEKISLWKSLNSFNMARPLILFDQLPWHELDVDGFLVNKVEDPYWRNVETDLRQQIYKWEHMPADMVLNPYVTLLRPIDFTGYGVEKQENVLQTDAENCVLSHQYTNQFEEMEDIQKIKTPRAILNRDAEQQIRQQADMIFNGIIDYKMNGIMPHFGFWDKISEWMGVDQVYIKLMDDPDLLHGIMEKMTLGTIEMIKQMNEDGLFDVYSNICHCSQTFEEDFPSKDADLNHPTSRDSWAIGLAQPFTAVSPDITGEFEIPYMKRLFPYLGRIYYGCCDRLDDRLELILELPNVRKISCSPWSNMDIFAQKLPHNYVMSNKPNPALFATDNFEVDSVQQHMAKTFSTAKNNKVNLELIFKDVSTVRYQPQRLWDTAKLAVEMANRF